MTVEVKLSEWKIDMPAGIPAGPTVFKVKNVGNKKHNFKIEGPGIERQLPRDLKAGETGVLELDLKPGTYQVICPVGLGYHKRKGMNLKLVVTQAQSG
jgi:uncharacterized cupredoxin-like copper-binding protein